MYSRIRAAGCDHGIENRFSMCGLICEPSPRKNRPFECRCRSLAVYAVSIGVRANATAMPVPELDALGVLGRDHERQERVVRGLRGEQPVVADVLELLARSPMSASDGAMIPVSTFMAAEPIRPDDHDRSLSQARAVWSTRWLIRDGGAGPCSV